MRDKRDDCVLVSNLNGTGCPGSAPTYLVRLCHNAAERIAELEEELGHRDADDAMVEVKFQQLDGEIDRLRAELATPRSLDELALTLQLPILQERAEKAEAKIARVREMCWESRLDGTELLSIEEIIGAIEDAE